MNPSSTAVVLIEFQNDFTTPGGKLHGAVQDVMQSTGMLDNTKETVERARAAGATIVHLPIQFAPGFREISELPYGILKGCKDGATFEKGSWGAEIVDTLKPKPEDIVVEGKEKGDLIRGLLAAAIRREPESAGNLISDVLGREQSWYSELRRPSDSDREQRIAHAVTPLLTVIVS